MTTLEDDEAVEVTPSSATFPTVGLQPGICR
jgi:hypothetical protein